MGDARYTKNGLLIPPGLLKGLGADVRIQRGDGVLIIESKQREAARKRLGRLVKKLRQADRESEPLSQDDIGVLVDEIRQARAGHR